jgi:hypothetical protein
MSKLVKTKRQANFKGFKRFGAFKGFVEQKNVWAFFGTRGPLKRPNLHTNSSNKLLLFNEFVCKLGFFGMSGPTSAKKGPIYARSFQHVVCKRNPQNEQTYIYTYIAQEL